MFKLDFLKNRKKFIKHGVQHNPNIYWMIIFFLGFFLTILAFVFGFIVFTKINKEDDVTTTFQSKRLDKISKERINKVLDLFKEKEETSNKVLNNTFPVVDPSL